MDKRLDSLTLSSRANDVLRRREIAELECRKQNLWLATKRDTFDARRDQAFCLYIKVKHKRERNTSVAMYMRCIRMFKVIMQKYRINKAVHVKE